MKPNCYDCKHRGKIPGDAHSRCLHPKVSKAHEDPLASLMGMLASVRRCDPVIAKAALELGIAGSPHGIRNGWFNWPWNFDPVWLLECGGFEKKEVQSESA